MKPAANVLATLYYNQRLTVPELAERVGRTAAAATTAESCPPPGRKPDSRSVPLLQRWTRSTTVRTVAVRWTTWRTSSSDGSRTAADRHGPVWIAVDLPRCLLPPGRATRNASHRIGAGRASSPRSKRPQRGDRDPTGITSRGGWRSTSPTGGTSTSFDLGELSSLTAAPEVDHCRHPRWADRTSTGRTVTPGSVARACRINSTRPVITHDDGRGDR